VKREEQGRELVDKIEMVKQVELLEGESQLFSASPIKQGRDSSFRRNYTDKKENLDASILLL